MFLPPDSQPLVVQPEVRIVVLDVLDVATGVVKVAVREDASSYCGRSLSMAPLGDRLAASSSVARVFDPSPPTHLATVPPGASSRTPPSAFGRVSSADLACLSPWARACLPSEVFSRVLRAAQGGVAHALSRKGTEVVEGGWLSHLPLGVLLRLPHAERHACISSVCKAPSPPR